MNKEEAALILLGKKRDITDWDYQQALKKNSPPSEKKIARAIYFELFRFHAWFYLLLPWLALPGKLWRQVKTTWQECKTVRETYHAPDTMGDVIDTIRRDRVNKRKPDRDGLRTFN